MAQEFRVGAQALLALSPGSGVVRLRPAGIPGGDATAHGPRREALVNMQASRCATRTRSNTRRRGEGQKGARRRLFAWFSSGSKIVGHTNRDCFGVISRKRGTASTSCLATSDKFVNDIVSSGKTVTTRTQGVMRPVAIDQARIRKIGLGPLVYEAVL